MSDLVGTKIESHIKRLSIGLLQHSYEQIYLAHRELVRIGKDVIPILEKQILSNPWNQVKDAARIDLLTGLLQLINELDEDWARNIVNEIRKNGCTPIVDVRISSLMKSSRADFESFDVKGIHLFISKTIPNRSKIVGKTIRWIGNIPLNDFAGISKVFVVPKRDITPAGIYIPILCSITIGCNPLSSFPLSWLFSFWMEHTFYHEIGHHTFRHIPGFHPDQEDQANRYSRRLMRKSHPFLGFALNMLHLIFRTNERHESRA